MPDSLSEHLGDVVACTQPVASALDVRGADAERDEVRAAGGRHVDVAPWMCTRATCAVVANLLVFRDDNHLTTSYASWLPPVLGAVLDEALRS